MWCAAWCARMPSRCKPVAYLDLGQCRYSPFSVGDAGFNESPNYNDLHWNDNYWHDVSCMACPTCNDATSTVADVDATTAVDDVDTTTTTDDVDTAIIPTTEAQPTTFKMTEVPTTTQGFVSTEIAATVTANFMPLCTLALSDGCSLNNNYDPYDPSKCA